MVKEQKTLLFPLQAEHQYLSHLFIRLLHLTGLKGEGSVARRPSVKHGRSAETQDAKEGRDFSPRDDQEDVLFLQKKH